MIEQERKDKINFIAELITSLDDNCSSGNVTLLDKVLEEQKIYLHEDHYEDAFDGALVYDNKKFHIHLNIDADNWIHTNRGRFTIAHELGHFFIIEHRENLKDGTYHFSNFSFNQKNIIEQEADYYASCLLFPETKFKNFCKEKPFNAQLITDISESFQTSQIAAIRRYCEIGNIPILMVYSENNQVKYFKKSNDFPFINLRFKIGQTPPKKSIAHDFFNNQLKDNSEIRSNYSNPWFDDIWEMKIHEQCIISKEYNAVISLIWF